MASDRRRIDEPQTSGLAPAAPGRVDGAIVRTWPRQVGEAFPAPGTSDPASSRPQETPANIEQLDTLVTADACYICGHDHPADVACASRHEIVANPPWACSACGGVHYRSPVGECPVTPISSIQLDGDLAIANATDFSTALDCIAMLHQLLRGRSDRMPVEFQPAPSSLQRATQRALESLVDLHALLLAAYRDVPVPQAQLARPPAASVPHAAGVGAGVPPEAPLVPSAPAPTDVPRVRSSARPARPAVPNPIAAGPRPGAAPVSPEPPAPAPSPPPMARPGLAESVVVLT